jgi:hypothetical protein
MPDYDEHGQHRGIAPLTPDQIRSSTKITYRANPPGFDPREELPGRREHRRRIAENLNRGCQEANSEPSGRPGGTHAVPKPHPSIRGPHN